MARVTRAAGVCVALVLGVAGEARAQPTVLPTIPGSNYRPGVNPTGTPTYSPYLNLLRRGNPAYQNYYGLVRPEVEFRSAVRGLQQQALQTQQSITGLETGAV